MISVRSGGQGKGGVSCGLTGSTALGSTALTGSTALGSTALLVVGAWRLMLILEVEG